MSEKDTLRHGVATRAPAATARQLVRLWVVGAVGGAAQCAVFVAALSRFELWSALLTSTVVPALVGVVVARRRARSWDASAWTLGTITALAVAGVFSLVVVPEHHDAGGTEHVEQGSVRSSGATLSVRTYGHDRTGSQPPVVSVHGGPGVPFTGTEERLLSEFGAGGLSVVYDQVGVGESSRLDDPRQYTLHRAITDLDNVIHASTRRPVVLLGYSWGARISVAYAAAHPESVAGLVFVSPGPFPWAGAEIPPYGPQDRLDGEEKALLYAQALAPRNLFLYSATMANPVAAHRLVGDEAANRRFADLYERTKPGLTCSHADSLDDPGPLGYFASQMPQLHADGQGVVRSDVDALSRIPALVIRGRCDYLPETVAAEYAKVWHTSVVPIPHAGHAAIESTPDVIEELVSKFRAGIAAARRATPR